MRQFLKPDGMAKIALIAGLYAALTLLPPFTSFSYYYIQIRVSEALTVLPYITPLAIPGLLLGCIISNIASPFLVWDISLGSLATLIAACLTRIVPKPYLAPIPPIIINSIVVGSYVSVLTGVPYWLTALSIAAGEIVACFGLGYPLLLYILRRPQLIAYLRGERQ